MINDLMLNLDPIFKLDGLNESSKSNLPISNQYNVLLTLATSNATMATQMSEIDGSLILLIAVQCIAWHLLFHVIPNYIFYILGNLDAFSNKISVIADLSVSSQIVYLGNGHIESNHDEEKEIFILNEENVVSLINILEPRLGMHI